MRFHHQAIVDLLTKHGDVVRQSVATILGVKQVWMSAPEKAPCGGYGCVVYLTDLPWVLKLTGSQSEARFQAWLSAMQYDGRRSDGFRVGFAIVPGVFEIAGHYGIVKERVQPLSDPRIKILAEEQKIGRGKCNSDRDADEALQSLSYAVDYGEIALEDGDRYSAILAKGAIREVAACFPEVAAGMTAVAKQGVAIWDVRSENMGMRLFEPMPGLGTDYPIIVDPEPAVQGRRSEGKTSKRIGPAPRGLVSRKRSVA